MQTYAGLVTVIKRLFTLVEDEYEPLNRIRHLKLEKGQTIGSLCNELIALKGASEGALSDKMCIAALVDCLASAGQESHVRSLCLASPITLEDAVALVCKTGPMVAAAHAVVQQYTHAHPASSQGPEPMQVDALSVSSGGSTSMAPTAGVVQQVAEVLIDTMQSRGIFDRGRPRDQSRGRSTSRGRYRFSSASHGRAHSRGRYVSKERERGYNRGPSSDRRPPQDPHKSPLWPAGVRRNHAALDRCRREGECYLCFSKDHTWQECTDPRYRVRPNAG
jgi:hypothetical protein